MKIEQRPDGPAPARDWTMLAHLLIFHGRMCVQSPWRAVRHGRRSAVDSAPTARQPEPHHGEHGGPRRRAKSDQTGSFLREPP